MIDSVLCTIAHPCTAATQACSALHSPAYWISIGALIVLAALLVAAAVIAVAYEMHRIDGRLRGDVHDPF